MAPPLDAGPRDRQAKKIFQPQNRFHIPPLPFPRHPLHCAAVLQCPSLRICPPCQDQTAQIAWPDRDLPVLDKVSMDPYFSLKAFGRGPPMVFRRAMTFTRFCDGFHICRAPHAFAPDLNLFVCAASIGRAAAQSGQLHFTTFEAFSPCPACRNMLRAHQLLFHRLTAGRGTAPFWSHSPEGLHSCPICGSRWFGAMRAKPCNTGRVRGRCVVFWTVSPAKTRDVAG